MAEAPPLETGQPEPRARRIALRGADTALGRKVLAQLANLPEIQLVDSASDSGSDSVAECRVDVVIDVTAADHDLLARRRRSVTRPTAELLAEADRCEAQHLVFVSSAMVYGAAPTNPIPLTEESLLRPDPDFVFARQLASAEHLVDAWRVAGPGRSVTVLRPVVMMSGDYTSGLARALAAGSAYRFEASEPGSQFVHIDDVARAVVHAAALGLDGVYNVAPDGWIPPDRRRALQGRAMSVPLPGQIADWWGQLRWRFQRGPIPPGLGSYITHPWIVANDKLRATGWAPQVTNDETYVEGTEAKWWTMVSPQRRQELALGALGTVAITALVLGLMAVFRWRSRGAHLPK